MHCTDKSWTRFNFIFQTTLRFMLEPFALGTQLRQRINLFEMDEGSAFFDVALSCL